MKFLLVDSHASLHALSAGLGPDAIVLQAGELQEALRLAAAHDDLDAVILTIPASGAGELHAIEEFGRLAARPPVIVLSASESAREAREALARGALGYVPGSASPRTLLSAIRLVLDGDLYVPPLILDETPSVCETGPPSLTSRQIEVLRRLSDGHSNKTIAQDLGVSEKTVKAHVTAIFKALNVVNRAQAASAGREAGLV